MRSEHRSARAITLAQLIVGAGTLLVGVLLALPPPTVHSQAQPTAQPPAPTRGLPPTFAPTVSTPSATAPARPTTSPMQTTPLPHTAASLPVLSWGAIMIGCGLLAISMRRMRLSRWEMAQQRLLWRSLGPMVVAATYTTARVGEETHEMNSVCQHLRQLLQHGLGRGASE